MIAQAWSLNLHHALSSSYIEHVDKKLRRYTSEHVCGKISLLLIVQQLRTDRCYNVTRVIG